MHREYGCAVLLAVHYTDTQDSSQSQQQLVKPPKPRDLHTPDAKAQQSWGLTPHGLPWQQGKGVDRGMKVDSGWGRAEEGNQKAKARVSLARVSKIKPHHYRDKVQEGLGSSTAKAALLSAWRTRVWAAALARQEGSMCKPHHSKEACINTHIYTHVHTFIYS